MKAFNRSSKVITNKVGKTTQLKSQPTKTIVDNRASTVLQRKLQQDINSSPRVLQAKFGKGLPAKLKENLENLSGISLDDVQVHYNSSQPAEVGALAYAQGTDIYLAPGQEKHLAHEAWHVVQQKQGRVRPTMQLETGAAINDNVGLEMEADRIGLYSQHAGQSSLQHEHASLPLLITKSEAQQPIQAKLDIDLISSIKEADNRQQNKLKDYIQSFNKLSGNFNKQRKANLGLQLLDQIEHKVYQWFTENQSGMLHPDSVAHTNMFKLLDDVQSEHKKIICSVVENKFGLPVPVEGRFIIEAPDKRKEEKEEEEKEEEKDVVAWNTQENIEVLWNALLSDDGPITVATTVPNEQYDRSEDEETRNFKIPEDSVNEMRIDILSTLARLLSRPKGRELVKFIVEKGNSDMKIQFVLLPFDKMILLEQFGPTTANIDDGGKLANLTHAFLNEDKTCNKGRGAIIRFSPGLEDSALIDSNGEGKPILSPTFIAIGHELIHAAHYMNGSFLPSTDSTNGCGFHPVDESARGKKRQKKISVYSNSVDELLTIEPSERLNSKEYSMIKLKGLEEWENENKVFRLKKIIELNRAIPTEGDIRIEHNLPIRYGHFDTTKYREAPATKVYKAQRISWAIGLQNCVKNVKEPATTSLRTSHSKSDEKCIVS